MAGADCRRACFDGLRFGGIKRGTRRLWRISRGLLSAYLLNIYGCVRKGIFPGHLCRVRGSEIHTAFMKRLEYGTVELALWNLRIKMLESDIFIRDEYFEDRANILRNLFNVDILGYRAFA